MSKTNEKHWEVILNFFEIHPGMATGRINAENGKQKMKKLWEELAMQLNSLGYGFKSSDKWLKTWTDFKYNLKKKASEIKKEQLKTGGGGPEGKVLHEYEQRALQFLGHGFVHGVGSSEVGVPKNVKTMVRCDSGDTPHPVPNSSNANSGASTLVFQADPSEYTPAPKRGNSTLISMDHNYTPQRKKKKNEDDNMYAETISVLKEIRDTVDRRLGEIVNVLNEKLP